MTRDTQHGREGHRRPRAPGGAPAASPPAGGEASIIGAVPLLAVLVVTVVGVYLAWRLGSAGGGNGGVLGGAALLAAAAARLLLPPRLAGLLANRRRAVDVATLAAFGIALLTAGLVLPR
jgi:hypothetical protein